MSKIALVERRVADCCECPHLSTAGRESVGDNTFQVIFCCEKTRNRIRDIDVIDDTCPLEDW